MNTMNNKLLISQTFLMSLLNVETSDLAEWPLQAGSSSQRQKAFNIDSAGKGCAFVCLCYSIKVKHYNLSDSYWHVWMFIPNRLEDTVWCKTAHLCVCVHFPVSTVSSSKNREIAGLAWGSSAIINNNCSERGHSQFKMNTQMRHM